MSQGMVRFKRMVTRLLAAAIVIVINLITVDCVTPPPYLPATFRGADGELEDMEFRVAVDPGKVECFFQEAKKDHQLEVSYQVIEISSRFGWLAPAGRDDLRIDFTLSGPDGDIHVIGECVGPAHVSRVRTRQPCVSRKF